MAADVPPTVVDMSSSAIRVVRALSFVAAALAIVVWVAGRRYGWLDYRPGGAAFDTYVSPALAALFVVAAVIALRWEIVGGILAAFAGAAIVAFASRQLVSLHAAIVVALVLVPAGLWIVVALAGAQRRALVAGLATTAVTACAGFVAGSAIYDHFWGPTHPASTATELPESPVEWVWSGSVTSTSGEVRARPESDDYGSVRLAVSTRPQFDSPNWVDSSDASGRVVGFRIDGLRPDTTYHYAVEIDGELDTTRAGEFTTFPQGPGSFTVAVGACARVGSNGAVFDTIREADPLLYLITGDLHYGDTFTNEIERYREVMDLTLSRPGQAALYRSAPIAYVWDDHDYGPNDADGTSPSREAAMAAFREYVPSYELASADSAVYQAFTVGRVRFVLTDARSARNLDADEEAGSSSMLGVEQKQWLKNELATSAETHELVVWVNPVPWVADERDGADHWGGFADERRELADHISDHGIDNLMMVSGDAHMVAIDDGSNTDYSTEGGAGFPLLHSAPLDRPAGSKGGPYSEGVVTQSGSFATIDFVDDGDDITVSMTGMSWDGTEWLSYEFSTADLAQSGQDQ